MSSRGAWPSSVRRRPWCGGTQRFWVLTDDHAVLATPLAVARCDLDLAMAAFGLPDPLWGSGETACRGDWEPPYGQRRDVLANVRVRSRLSTSGWGRLPCTSLPPV
jgi:hypothetical protein